MYLWYTVKDICHFKWGLIGDDVVAFFILQTAGDQMLEAAKSPF